MGIRAWASQPGLSMEGERPVLGCGALAGENGL